VVSADHGASFCAIVTNGWGTVASAPARLTVKAAPDDPRIAVPPRDQIVAAGQSVSFGVTAAGSASLSYQWQENGMDILGATAATYTIPVTTLGDSKRLFRCVVTNASGNAASACEMVQVSAAGSPTNASTSPPAAAPGAAQPAPALAALKPGDSAHQFKLKGADGQGLRTGAVQRRESRRAVLVPAGRQWRRHDPVRRAAGSHASDPHRQGTGALLQHRGGGRDHGFRPDGPLSFPVRSDSDKAVAQAYGCLRADGLSRRWTFLIDAQGTILAVDKSITPQTQGSELLKMLADARLVDSADSR
jgi:peroxiredoxin